MSSRTRSRARRKAAPGPRTRSQALPRWNELDPARLASLAGAVLVACLLLAFVAAGWQDGFRRAEVAGVVLATLMVAGGLLYAWRD